MFGHRKDKPVEVKILDVRKINWLKRLFTVKHWDVEFSVGRKIYRKRLWAGAYEPSASSLLSSVRWALEDAYRSKNKKDPEIEIYGLVGKHYKFNLRV